MRSHRISSTIAAATTLAVVLGGCGSDEQEPEVLPGESDSAGTNPDEAATTAEGTEGTSGEDESTEDAGASEGEDPVSDDGSGESGGSGDGGQTGLPTVPDEYADALVVAWGAGDQGTMTRLGTDEVVHILGDGGGPDWAQTGFEGAAGSTMVTYEDSGTGDTLVLRVDNAAASEGAEHAVVEATFTTGGDDPGLPTEPVAYADALVVAWGAGNQETMAQLGTDEVVHILGDGGGPDWAQTGSEGAAGSTIVTYQNSQSGDVLTLRVDNAAASEGAEQAVVEARYETD